MAAAGATERAITVHPIAKLSLFNDGPVLELLGWCWGP
jgi:hypothetical protein